MSKKNKNAIDEEQALIDKAKNIISLEKSIKDLKDRTYIEGVKYIFTKEFTQKSLSLPIKKKDKESFQYLKNFVGILDILFKMDESERHKLYQCEISSKTIGHDLFNSIQNLNLLANRKKIGNFNMNNLSEQVKSIFTNYIKSMSNNVLGSLNLYFYYIGFFIESIDSFKFILYYFLQLTDIFQKFEYKDFCPDLKSNNCLNLIILLFKNIQEPLETLAVYALLIFKYKYIFKGIEENINESILEKTVNQSAEIVKEKTFKNPIILEYIFNEFIDNLSYNIIYPNNPESFNEIIINEKNEDKKLVNDIKNNENKIPNNTENIETMNDKSEIKDDSSLDKSEKPNKDENHSKDNNSVNEEINNRNKLNIDDKDNDNSTIIENNNNNNNRTKESNLSNEIISNNTNEKKINININKKDYTNNNEATNNSTLLQNEVNQSSQIQLLFNEINNLKIENNEMKKQIKEMAKQSEERYQKLQNEMILLKSKLEKVTNTIGYIQMRDCAKNLLKPYQDLLTKEDNEKIEKDHNKKWELIANKIKDSYKRYENSKNYKAFIEIMEKSVDLIKKGNRRAHNITLEYYEKNIEKIKVSSYESYQNMLLTSD